MNWKSLIIGTFVSVLFSTANAQVDFNLLNAKTPDEIGKIPESHKLASRDAVLPYGYISDRDILWSKVVWEHIDLDERINLPLYYPIDSTFVDSGRKSLFYALLEGIQDGRIKEVYDDSFFKSKLTMTDINEKLTRVDTSDYAYELLNEGETNIKDYVDEISIQAQDIDGYRIKGIWYFDKRQGEMKYRILALAPMAPDVQIIGREDIQDESLPLFWVFYPSARDVLHESMIFNGNNPRHPVSFDQVFNARRFSAVIVREENIYGNRSISDYIRGNAMFQIMESERIKESIRNKELDMWNY